MCIFLSALIALHGRMGWQLSRLHPKKNLPRPTKRSDAVSPSHLNTSSHFHSERQNSIGADSMSVTPVSVHHFFWSANSASLELPCSCKHCSCPALMSYHHWLACQERCGTGYLLLTTVASVEQLSDARCKLGRQSFCPRVLKTACRLIV